MAGEMTPEQWGFIKGGLDKISLLCEKTIPEMKEEIRVLNLSIIGNGVKGLKQEVYEIKDDLEKTKKDLEKKIDAVDKKPCPKPRYSWPQVITMAVIIVGLFTFLFAFNQDQYAKIVRIEDQLHEHIVTKP